MKICKRSADVILLLMASVSFHSAYAADPVCQAQSLQNISIAIESAVPCADQIVMKTRWHNGVLQYRRWNKTKGCWVDPDWIDMP